REVGFHYLKLVLVIAILGVTLGSGVGAWLGRGLTAMYTRFYRFPMFAYSAQPNVFATALLVAGGAAVLGTLGAVRKAVHLTPAEAMRPEPPHNYKPTILERLGLQRFFPQVARMVLRNLERQPFKSLLASFGIALAVAVLVLGNFMEDSIDYMM